MGAMMFSSAGRTQTDSLALCLDIYSVFIWEDEAQLPTDEDEGEADAEGQDVSAQRLVVFTVTLRKNSQTRIDVVLTESLESQQLLLENTSGPSSFIHITHLFKKETKYEKKKWKLGWQNGSFAPDLLYFYALIVIK